ncbi:MAG: glycosyltransferase family 39 protein [Patescibacteria group bacterium]
MSILLETIHKNMKRPVVGALFVILLLGVGLRVWHQSDLLVLKSDQARDALIMHTAFQEGFQTLPLLGPQAGSTEFKLGPATYYFQYLSGKIFGGSVESLAYPDLLFGILVIPVFFLLFRRFFSVPLSLWLTTLSSVSLLLVTFSRFAWNPNSLPFFTALFTVFFLSALDATGRKRLWLLVSSAFAFGIIAQLHLVPTVALGFSLVLFILFSRTLKWKEVLLALSIIVVMQGPIFLSEYQTGGGNMGKFFGAVQDDTYQDKGHNSIEKVIRAYQHNARNLWLMATGNQDTDVIAFKGFSLKCDKKCDEAMPYTLSALVLFTFVLIVSFLGWKKEKDARRKRDLSFILLWSAGFFLVTILVAYEVQTRFYLGIVPAFFILLGLGIECILSLSSSLWWKRIILFFGIVILGINLQTTLLFLGELARSQVSAEESSRDLRFGSEPKVTLGQLRAIGKGASQHFPKGEPVFISGESRYTKSMYYVLSKELGYPSCYMRGEESVPAGLHHLFLSENKPEKNAPESLPFGTLSASFTIADIVSEEVTFPAGCLTY